MTSSTLSWGRFLVVVILAVIFCPSQARVEAKVNSGDGQTKGPLSHFNGRQLGNLRAGEPVCEYKVGAGESETIVGYGQCSIIINAPLKKCFESLSSIENQVHYVPGKEKGKIVGKSEGKLLVENEYLFYGITIKYHSLFSIDEKKYRIEWKGLDKYFNKREVQWV